MLISPEDLNILTRESMGPDSLEWTLKELQMN